jgi:hypothetical protein
MKTHMVLRSTGLAVVTLFATSLALASPEITANQEATVAAPAPVAYVYVQTLKGVNLYYAAANGALTLVPGSPFQTVGEMVGSNGKYFFSLGTHWIHVYPIAANGAIKPQVSQINTQNYTGDDCGSAMYGVLDHTGQDLYILIGVPGVFPACSAYQSFRVNETTGALTFVGGTKQFGVMAPLAITANDRFAYSTNDANNSGGLPFIGFAREASGALGTLNLTETDPTPPFPWNWIPWIVRADPANHLAVALGSVENWASPLQQFGPVQLGSYSVDTQGNITTTNTPEQMPVPDVGPTLMTMSPSGNVLAVAGTDLLYATCGWCTIDLQVTLRGTGLQLFHFNGSQPITPFGKTLTTNSIDQAQWDRNGHLYAVSEDTGKLYVYTVTAASITQAPGSPHSIQNPRIMHSNGLIVVPR